MKDIYICNAYCDTERFRALRRSYENIRICGRIPEWMKTVSSEESTLYLKMMDRKYEFEHKTKSI